ncbi:glycerophosphodiester phosphodiesterase family protein [Halocynthiibacter namhaensis]|uniref:glycerophosphodiester phosphodiesterase family protein n=1 Tax=Halocynthiibacter namhaensis TaxID=1290553 RepID=UPI00057917DE|nr:glycerophosphodiester phosphodiesterase family protein [Halocynthiibacter namhaensis]
MTRPVLPDTFLKAPFTHRGYHDISAGIPENSIAAFKAAIDAGYGIELDVQATKDADAMVFHDYDMKRLTGTQGPIQLCNLDEVCARPLLGNNEQIPTLSNVLDLVAGRVPLLIEIKDQHGAMGPVDGRLEHAVARALHGYVGPVALMSFNPHSVAVLAEAMPDIPRGITTENWLGEEEQLIPAARRAELVEIQDYDRVQACFISHQASDLHSPQVARLKALGANVLCWTIRNKAEETQARKVAQNVTFEGYAAALCPVER